MLLIGLAFLLFAALLKFTTVGIVLAAAIVGVVYVVVGLLRGERL